MKKRRFRQMSVSAFTVIREERIPFEVSIDPFYSESNIRSLENIVRDIKDGKLWFLWEDKI